MGWERPRTGATPTMGFVAPEGTGKTTLLNQVVKLLTVRGLKIGVLKQARDDFDMDQPGKDSYRLRKAGVDRLMLTSSQKLALFIEHPDKQPEFEELLALFHGETLDLILLEGFAEQAVPKIHLFRGEGQRREDDTDPWIVALATDRGEIPASRMPILDINEPAAVATFILDYFPALGTQTERD